jgi:uncharacterized protein
LRVAKSYTAFAGGKRIGHGDLAAVEPAVKQAYGAGLAHLLVFDDATGRLIDLGADGAIAITSELVEKPTRGRPRLGVTAREVTLLPNHWEWLSQQPGGASAALRRLVDEARRAGPNRARETRDAAHRVMSALAGDAPNFEEASRAFYAKDYAQFDVLTRNWPLDVRQYVTSLVHRVAAAETDNA